jgi:hypothetical protein
MITKKVYSLSELDQRIAKLRTELLNLYTKRAAFITFTKKIAINHNSEAGADNLEIVVVDKWAKEEYQKLKLAWQKYDILIPEFIALRARLIKAHEIIRKITFKKPELKFRIGLIIVPPQEVLQFPVDKTYRKKQKFVEAADIVSENLPLIACDKWRLLITCNALNGLYLQKPIKKNIKSSYYILGYKADALGLTEYAALTLQHPHIIDKGTSTLLLKGYNGEEQVAIAGFTRGSYRFLRAHIDSTFYDFRFRPTIEIL